MARGEARAAAMQLIYEDMLGGGDGGDTLPGLLGFLPCGDDEEYIAGVVSGVRDKQQELDSKIGEHLVNWSIDRLSRVDLSILRLAVYEILFRDDVPNAVAVNEAVELSHVYSTDEAGGFINGVLGSLLRANRKPSPVRPSPGQPSPGQPSPGQPSPGN